jgi:hypothetical protein
MLAEPMERPETLDHLAGIGLKPVQAFAQTPVIEPPLCFEQKLAPFHSFVRPVQSRCFRRPVITHDIALGIGISEWTLIFKLLIIKGKLVLG